MLTILLTKISPTGHRFEYRRGDGAGEVLPLETKTFLFHDLLHFAVESEAGLAHSFYGLLARNASYAALSDGGNSDLPPSEEIGMTERIVGALTGVIKGEATPEDFLVGMQNIADAYAVPLPEWLTVDFVVRVQERMRRLLGEWNRTPFGATMRLEFAGE